MISLMDKMNECDEIENKTAVQISNASTTKRGKPDNRANIKNSNTPLAKMVQPKFFKTKLRASRNNSPSNCVLEKSSNEKFKVYEDEISEHSTQPEDSMPHGRTKSSNIPKTRGGSRRNTAKSSIPISKTTAPSARITRSRE